MKTLIVMLPLLLLCIVAACGDGTGDAAGSNMVPEYASELPSPGEEGYFILVGDPQRTGLPERLLLREQNDSARAAVMLGIAMARPDFLVILGDLVYQADDDDAWMQFDSIMLPVRRAHIPVYPLLGNHEYFGDEVAGRKKIDTRFPSLRREDWYELRYGTTALLLINTNRDDMEVGQRDRQERWYSERLALLDADSTVAHVIVCGHHPPYTNSMIVSASGEVEKDFVLPFLDARKTALFFSGHCHSYEHFRNGDKHFIVTGGGGGPRQELDRCWRRRYDDLFPGADIRSFHYCSVHVRNDTLRMTMHRLLEDMTSWSVGDEITIYPGKES